MSTASDRAYNEAIALPSDARIALVDKILASLNLPTKPEIDQMWAEEAERRVAETEGTDTALIPGEEVFDRIRRKHAR